MKLQAVTTLDLTGNQEKDLYQLSSFIFDRLGFQLRTQNYLFTMANTINIYRLLLSYA